MKNMMKSLATGNLFGTESCKAGNPAVKELRDFWKDEEGMGTIEVVLILVVLIGLVITFKSTISSVLDGIMQSITDKTGEVTGVTTTNK